MVTWPAYRQAIASVQQYERGAAAGLWPLESSSHPAAACIGQLNVTIQVSMQPKGTLLSCRSKFCRHRNNVVSYCPPTCEFLSLWPVQKMGFFVLLACQCCMPPSCGP